MYVFASLFFIVIVYFSSRNEIEVLDTLIRTGFNYEYDFPW